MSMLARSPHFPTCLALHSEGAGRAGRRGLALAIVLTLSSWAGTAAALGTAGPRTGGPAGLIELLCEDDCSGLAAQTKPDDSPFAFAHGTKAIADGFDLEVFATGSVYLVGPLSADEIVLNAINTVELNGQLGDGLDDTRIDDRRIDGGGVIICACLEVVAGSGVSPLTSAVVGSGDGQAANPTFRIWREGDVYIDLSMVSLGRLSVEALDSIVIGGAGTDPVPEPGPAVLLGLGLAVLARSRSRSHSGA